MMGAIRRFHYGVVLLALLIASLLVGWQVIDKGIGEKIMMIPAREQPAFDATRWFASGMYRNNESPLEGWKYKPYGMTRVSPPPFPDEQLPDLRSWIAFGVKNDYG